MTTKAATISNCGKYRYQLSRTWNNGLPPAAFIMLNPSTADDKEDDNTIRKCIAYCKSWGYGSLHVVNLFPYRTKSPAEMMKIDELSDEVMARNDIEITHAINNCDIVICAWSNHGSHKNESIRIKELLIAHDAQTYYLQINKTGEPAHPLYLKSSLKPTRWILN